MTGPRPDPLRDAVDRIRTSGASDLDAVTELVRAHGYVDLHRSDPVHEWREEVVDRVLDALVHLGWTVTPPAVPGSLVLPWDGIDPPDYEPPVEPGDRVVLRRGETEVRSVVVATAGYFPGVVELEHGLRVDLVGWDLTR